MRIEQLIAFDKVVQHSSFTKAANELYTTQPSVSKMIDALEEPLQSILESVRNLFERTPPELASDITENGICLTGGGALLYGMDKFISEHTKVPCYVAEDPISCVAIGTGKALDSMGDMEPGTKNLSRRKQMN